MNNSGIFDLAMVYACFSRFVDLYLPNTLHTKFTNKGNQALPFLKLTLQLVEQLLNFHERDLANHLKHHKLSLEMFMTSWVLTLFTRLVPSLTLLYELWEIFLFERDRYMIFYVAVAILRKYKSKILGLKEFEKLMKFLTAEVKI